MDKSPINKHMLRYDGNVLEDKDDLIDENIFERQTDVLGQNLSAPNI